MSKNCYITTPIYYASGRVHIGNSYSTIACDTFARYHRLKGDNTYFLTGMDEHGQKIENVAKEKNQLGNFFVASKYPYAGLLDAFLSKTNNTFPLSLPNLLENASFNILSDA